MKFKKNVTTGIMNNRERLSDLSRFDYKMLLKEGMLFEFYPEATGDYEEDVIDD